MPFCSNCILCSKPPSICKTFCDCCCIVVFLLYLSLIADILSVHRLGKVWCNLSAIIFLSKKCGLECCRLFCFGSLVILDVARCYLWLFTLYINIKIGKNSC